MPDNLPANLVDPENDIPEPESPSEEDENPEPPPDDDDILA